MSLVVVFETNTWPLYEIHVYPLQLELGISMEHPVHGQAVLVGDQFPKLRGKAKDRTPEIAVSKREFTVGYLRADVIPTLANLHVYDLAHLSYFFMFLF